jgi:hypothetical protein
MAQPITSTRLRRKLSGSLYPKLWSTAVVSALRPSPNFGKQSIVHLDQVIQNRFLGLGQKACQQCMTLGFGKSLQRPGIVAFTSAANFDQYQSTLKKDVLEKITKGSCASLVHRCWFTRG